MATSNSDSKPNTNRILFITLLVIVAIAAAGAFFIARSGPGAAPLVKAGGPAVTPKPAPDFELQLTSGKKLRLSDLRGKQPVVINFWASWCPPCREEAPVLARVGKDFKDQVRFVGIIVNDKPGDAKAFMEEFGVTYDNGHDTSNIANDYGITGIPETFWIDKSGRIVDHWIGAIDEANLVDRTRKLL